MCCIGCRAVAEWIGELGLADYYRLRSDVGTAAPDLDETAKNAAALDRPEMSRHLVRTLADGRSEAIVLVDGVRCGACGWLIERTLDRLPGVLEVGVNAGAQRARIVYDGRSLSIARIVDALARVGYRALPLDRSALDDTQQREKRNAQKRVAVAGLGAMQAMMYAIALWFGALDGLDAITRDLLRWLTLLAATPVVFYSAAPFFAGARRSLAAGQLGMDVPVALAIALIYAGSVVEVITGGADVWFESVSMFVFFLGTGRYIEMRARHRGSDLCDALARLTPAFADRVEKDGSLSRVGAMELVPGDSVVVADGGRVPADGVLETAECHVDESMLCGESAPIRRRRGESICGGSVVVDTPATVRVTRVGPDTVVAGIVALTTRAATARTRVAGHGERAASKLIALMLVLAACTAIGWSIIEPARAFPATVAVLVVVCPCAYALAAPAAITRALAVLAGHGVLVMRPDALENLAVATHVLFDKTGTLTEPSIARDRSVMLRDIDPYRALALAAALAQGSRHALARAFTSVAPAMLPAVDARESIVGSGIAGIIDGRHYRLGRSGYACAQASIPDDAVVLADDDGAIAAFAIDERLRPGSREAVDALTRAGVDVAIASGDTSAKVAAAATSLGIATWSARQSPADKLGRLESLCATGARVVVAGDGVNDAPMLAHADVGVAVGSAADVAQAASDIVITGSLRGLANARSIAQQMLSVLGQNRRWALIYNLAAAPLAALGFVPPWLAAVGMSASSLVVLMNLLRIGRASAKHEDGEVARMPQRTVIPQNASA